MENSDNLILINIKDYEELLKNDVKYKSLIATILNPKNVELTTDKYNYSMFSVASGIIMNLVENFEPLAYATTYNHLKKEKEKERERINKELEKSSIIIKS